jgi:hypothetical protein
MADEYRIDKNFQNYLFSSNRRLKSAIAVDGARAGLDSRLKNAASKGAASYAVSDADMPVDIGARW